MSRPSMSAATTSKKLTKAEKTAKMQMELRLKGKDNNITPPKHLTVEQAEIFNYIVQELNESKILGNLDIYILSQCSVAIDRLQNIEKMINKNLDLLSDSPFMASKEKYTRDFYRCCNELGLSPQSRAKMGNINMQAEKIKSDPILHLLGGGKT